MGLLFLGNEGENFVAMVEEVAERVENLGLGEAQSLRDVGNGLPTLMEGGDMTNCHAQAVNDRLAAADAWEADDMWVLGLHDFGHTDFSEETQGPPSPL
jgi:hypothetical protein